MLQLSKNKNLKILQSKQFFRRLLKVKLERIKSSNQVLYAIGPIFKTDKISVIPSKLIGAHKSNKLTAEWT